MIRKILIFIWFMLMMMFLSAQDLLKKTIAYTVPGMEKITVHKNITYKTVDGKQLKMDIYMPPVKDRTQRYPVVVFVHGGPIMASMTPPKEWGVFTSYGRLAAASGLVGVTFNHRYYGLKDAPPIKKSIQEFVNESFKVNILIDFLNHPGGFHGFDVLNDDDRSKDIIKRTIQFIKGGYYDKPRKYKP